MSSIQDMQDKAVEITLAGKKYTARQLYARDWAQIERDLKREGLTLNDIYSGEPTIIGYLAVVKVAIGKEVPPRASQTEVFEGAAAILNLDLAEGETVEKNSQQTREES